MFEYIVIGYSILLFMLVLVSYMLFLMGDIVTGKQIGRAHV